MATYAGTLNATSTASDNGVKANGSASLRLMCACARRAEEAQPNVTCTCRSPA